MAWNWSSSRRGWRIRPGRPSTTKVSTGRHWTFLSLELCRNRLEEMVSCHQMSSSRRKAKGKGHCETVCRLAEERTRHRGGEVVAVTVSVNRYTAHKIIHNKSKMLGLSLSSFRKPISFKKHYSRSNTTNFWKRWAPDKVWILTTVIEWTI